MSTYNIGQVVYAILAKSMSVQPFQVVEVITKKNLQGESTSYVLRTFYDDKEYIEVDSKINAEFFASAEIARTTLMMRAESAIEKIIDLATENARSFFQQETIFEKEDVTSQTVPAEPDNQSVVETIIEGKRVKVRLPKT
jgi:hypothetical protein